VVWKPRQSTFHAARQVRVTLACQAYAARSICNSGKTTTREEKEGHMPLRWTSVTGPIGLGRGPHGAEKSPWHPKEPRRGRYTPGAASAGYNRLNSPARRSESPPSHSCLPPTPPADGDGDQPARVRQGPNAPVVLVGFLMELRRMAVGVAVAP
jgi:hypothetical protein